jgi:hypothetical protein
VLICARLSRARRVAVRSSPIASYTAAASGSSLASAVEAVSSDVIRIAGSVDDIVAFFTSLLFGPTGLRGGVRCEMRCLICDGKK